ncbi:MAG: SDR family NAD(P)-dependent oxidoreductase [Haloferacaceae archaeon]
MRLEERTIVVTGGSSGIGKAAADAFVTEGADVVVAGRTAERLEAAVDSFSGPGRALGVQADVRSWDAVEELFEETEREYGAIDVLLNNAGVTGNLVREESADPTVADVAVDTWETVIDTNLTGAFHSAKAALTRMCERDSGRLIHVSSGMGSSGRAGWAPYVASKHGLEGLAETIALELEGSGVDSVAFRPPGGGVHTSTRERAGRTPTEFTHEPAVVAEPLVQLAAGAGEHGGRYVGTPDGEAFERYDREG